MRRTPLLVLCATLGACQGLVSDRPGDSGTPILCDTPTDADAGPQNDVLTPSRLLRRAALALTGTPPTDADYAALEAAGDDAAQRTFVDTYVDQQLASPVFYRTLFEFGRDWFALPSVPSTADAPEYGAQQQRALIQCGANTPEAGKWSYYREDYEGGSGQICSGVWRDGGVVTETTVEPWFAPGTSITLVGSAASTATMATTTNLAGNWVVQPCNGHPAGNCGCGPNAVNCHADPSYAGFPDYVMWNEHGQRRQLSEEPARLFAHLAWFDRSMLDLVEGTSLVGTTRTIAAYVMQGSYTVDNSMLTDPSWWKPDQFKSAPHDPLHADGDPEGWREFDLPTISKVFIADRSYHYDPRVEHTPMKGLPAAGMLTSMGLLAAQPRERLRAARMLEQLACEVLSPPSGQNFNPYISDPATEGPCQNCHRRIDPAAIHFKRLAKQGAGFEGFGASYVMPNIGNWTIPKAWRTGQWPYDGEPYAQWNRWYRAGSALTPVLQSQIDEDPMSVFIDFLPTDQTLLGQVSDGTNGPLGFAKLIVAAGAFDRCVVRHLHQLVLGRDVDPAKEAGYLDQLTSDFVTGGRKARPFVKSLTKSTLFSRGF